MKTCAEKKIGTPDKYVLIRSGIKLSVYGNAGKKEEARKKLGIGPQEKVISTIGPFKPQKNLSDFIEMARLVADSAKQARFIMVGDGQQRRLLEEKTARYSLQEKVSFLGWRDDIPEILSATDVFVMTALWEGLPRSVVEALVSGVPVVAYAVDGTREIIKDGESGFLVKPKDFASLARKVLTLLDDGKTLERMSGAAKGSVDKTFDIEYMVRQQEELYLALVE